MCYKKFFYVGLRSQLYPSNVNLCLINIDCNYEPCVATCMCLLRTRNYAWEIIFSLTMHFTVQGIVFEYFLISWICSCSVAFAGWWVILIGLCVWYVLCVYEVKWVIIITHYYSAGSDVSTWHRWIGRKPVPVYQDLYYCCYILCRLLTRAGSTVDNKASFPRSTSCSFTR